MKYIKKYKIFLEEIDFDPEITDEPDLKMSKEKLTTIKNQLSEFKAKKPLIDKAYLSSNTDDDLKTSIEGILGKQDVLPNGNRNPFLVEYLNVANLNRKIDKLQKEIVNDKISKDDFTEQISLSTEQSVKDAINIKLKDIINRISTKTSTIASLTKDVSDASKNLDTKMKGVETDMEGYIKNISNTNK